MLYLHWVTKYMYNKEDRFTQLTSLSLAFLMTLYSQWKWYENRIEIQTANVHKIESKTHITHHTTQTHIPHHTHTGTQHTQTDTQTHTQTHTHRHTHTGTLLTWFPACPWQSYIPTDPPASLPSVSRHLRPCFNSPKDTSWLSGTLTTNLDQT